MHLGKHCRRNMVGRVRKLAFGQLLSEVCQHLTLSGYDLLFCGRPDWCFLYENARF